MKKYAQYIAAVAVFTAVIVGGRALTAQITDLPTKQFTPAEAKAGIVLKANTHNYFSCETNDTWPVIDKAMGSTRFWIYEFTGSEPPFTGDFYISQGELAQNPQLNSINTLRAFKGGRRYYFMSQYDIQFSCGQPLIKLPNCGDGVKDINEMCDDGNRNNGDGCNAQCGMESICGNGIIEGAESCDDKNTAKFDGCSETCDTEAGFTCEGQPSRCDLLVPTLPNNNGGGSSSSSSQEGTSSSSEPMDTTCNDSDGGMNFYKKGTAKLGDKELTDSCDGNTLLESSCQFGFMEGTMIECEFGCKDGACNRGSGGTPGGAEGGEGGAGDTGLNVTGLNLLSASIANRQLKLEYKKEKPTCLTIFVKQAFIFGDRPILQSGEQTCGDNEMARINLSSLGGNISIGDEIRVCQGDVCSNYKEVVQGSAEPSKFSGAIIMKEIGTSFEVDPGTPNVRVMRFEARAIESDLLLKKFVAWASLGDLTSAEVYTLRYDSDGDGVAETEIGKTNEGNGVIVFETNVLIQKETNVAFEVLADIANDPASEMLQLTVAEFDKQGAATSSLEVDRQPVIFETTDLDRKPMGVEYDGKCDSFCEIAVSTTESAVVNFTDRGPLSDVESLLYVTKSTIPVREQQLLAGELTNSVLNLDFRAEKDDTMLTSIAFIVNSGAPVERLELYQRGENKLVGIATRDCPNRAFSTSLLCAQFDQNAVIVPKDREVTLEVRPFIVSDQDGARSGQKLDITLEQGSRPVAALAKSSRKEAEVFIGTERADGEQQDIRSVEHTIVLSKIISITNGSTDQNGLQIALGESDIGAFTFTAAKNTNSERGVNTVSFDNVTFNVAAENVALYALGFFVYNKEFPAQKSRCQARYLSGEVFTSSAISGNFLLDCGPLPSDIDSSVASGKSTTFVVQGEVLQPKVNPSSAATLQVSLEKFSKNDDDTPHVQWYDIEGGNNVRSYDWIEYSDDTVRSTKYQN